MKLLFDQNLSFRLVDALRDIYPGSSHVRLLGLAQDDDEVVWRYAKERGFLIVSKDADFHQLSFVFGAPPKVVWLRTGNCTTARIEALLRDQHSELVAFANDEGSSFFLLG